MSMSFRRLIQSSVVLVMLSFLAVPVLAQEPFSAEGIPPESDFVYRKQYDQVQEIMKTPDIAEREKKLETFWNKLPQGAKIRQYGDAYFTQISQAYEKAGQKDKAAALNQKIMKMFPKADSQLGPQFKAAFDSKDWAKTIELGEKLRAAAPNDGQVLVMLAQAYQSTNNNAKVMVLAPKLIEVLGAKKAINYVVFMADQYRTQKDLNQAAQYYDMALQAYPSGVPEGWQAPQWNAVKATAFQVKATQAWTAKDYRTVISAYNEVLKADSKNDAAYLFIGLSHWQLQELDAAQDAFAKATVLGKTNSQKAKQYLDQIYSKRNNNSLDGLDKVLAKAKADLGV